VSTCPLLPEPRFTTRGVLLLPVDPADARALLTREWSWFLARHAPGRSFRPVAVTTFGDWFLEDRATRSVWFLDVGMGILKQAALTRADLAVALRDPRNRQSWCLEGQLRQLLARGVELEAGQCFSWRIAPCAGGGLDADNFAPVPVELHQRVQSRLVYHLGDLPAGTPVTQEMIGEIFEGLDDPLPGQAAEATATAPRFGLPLGGIAAGIALMAALLGFVL
jgi:hypothetical protein